MNCSHQHKDWKSTDNEKHNAIDYNNIDDTNDRALDWIECYY